jgi:hypothetical protein
MRFSDEKGKGSTRKNLSSFDQFSEKAVDLLRKPHARRGNKTGQGATNGKNTSVGSQ